MHQLKLEFGLSNPDQKHAIESMLDISSLNSSIFLLLALEGEKKKKNHIKTSWLNYCPKPIDLRGLFS